MSDYDSSDPSVLLYEPELLLREGLEQWLAEAEGLKLVYATSDAQRAVDSASEHQPDVLLMSGYGTSQARDISVLSSIKKANPSVAALVLSTDDGTPMDINESKCIEAGAAKVLTKYLSLDEILSELLIAFNAR